MTSPLTQLSYRGNGRSRGTPGGRGTCLSHFLQAPFAVASFLCLLFLYFPLFPRCWLLSPQIREFHAQHLAPISVAGTDGESDGSEQGGHELTTGEQAATEANSQSTDATHVHTRAEDLAWELTRRRQLNHDCLAAGFCKMSSYELTGLDFGVCEVIEVISSLFLSSETIPEDMTAWVSCPPVQGRLPANGQYNLESRNQPCLGTSQR